MSRAAVCVRHGKCSQMDSAHMEVKVTCSRCVGDGQCNRNQESQVSEKNVEQNASMFHQLLAVC